jgi:hypothetical protein
MKLLCESFTYLYLSSLIRDKTVHWASSPSWLDDNRFVILRMDELVTTHIVWAFQKDSEFTEFFDFQLNWLKENGVSYKEYTERVYKTNKERD